ncbi:MAG: hypothetical protein H6739_05545 [Alphaproteobacteria bacterium]|nr:hypothetical protein [Alphaproteobacteria bacterium]
MRLALLLLAACTGKEPVDSSDDGPPINQGNDSGDECYGNDPVLTSITLTNGGAVQFDDGTFPTIQVNVEGEDADGNLDVITLEIWFDADVDEQVDTSGPDTVSQVITLSANDCVTTTGSASLRVQVGSGLSYNTLYDVAARITDAEGEVSNALVTTGSTPRENGLDGDGTGP